MRRNLSNIIAVALGIATLGSSAFGQNDVIHTRYNLSVASSADMERIPPRQGLSDKDLKFLIVMARVHMAEIQFGQLAQRNGGEWAQGYGKDMVREHMIALEEVKKAAADNGLAVPKDVDATTKKSFSKLSQLHGSAFDEAYRQMMISGHKQVLDLVQDEIRAGYNSDARGYAVTAETAVKLHLRLAQEQTTMMGAKNG
ncbi:MAG: DUF4142 domain-containing protein [Fimbriimonadales bacterium]